MNIQEFNITTETIHPLGPDQNQKFTMQQASTGALLLDVMAGHRQ